MYTSLLLPALLAVGALGRPAGLEKRVMETEVVIMTTTTTLTIDPSEATGAAGNGINDINKGVGNGDNGDQGASSWSWSWSWSSPASSPTPAPAPSSPSAPVDSPAPSPSPSPAPTSPSAPASPTTTDTPSSPPPSSPSPSPSGGSSGNSPLSGGVAMIDTINKWRSAMGKSALTWDSTLEGNVQRTVDDSAAQNAMNHELFPGTSAQNLGPGFSQTPSGTVQFATGIAANGQTWEQAMQGMTPFEITYVAWLCEKPDAPGLTGSVDYCSVDTNILNSHNKEPGTGHFDNLVGDFSKIACAFATNASPDPTWPQFQGIWGCDLA